MFDSYNIPCGALAASHKVEIFPLRCFHIPSRCCYPAVLPPVVVMPDYPQVLHHKGLNSTDISLWTPLTVSSITFMCNQFALSSGGHFLLCDVLTLQRKVEGRKSGENSWAYKAQELTPDTLIHLSCFRPLLTFPACNKDHELSLNITNCFHCLTLAICEPPDPSVSLY